MARSILIVDDDVDIVLTIQDILSAEGYPVDTARNGKEGLSRLEENPAGLILLDLWMPEMNGEEMAKQVRERGYSMPILIMSAMQGGKQIARQINAAGFVPKPFDIDVLLAEIRRLLGNPHPGSA
jgi:DNA-binding response OmpR family regulator